MTLHGVARYTLESTRWHYLGINHFGGYNSPLYKNWHKLLSIHLWIDYANSVYLHGYLFHDVITICYWKAAASDENYPEFILFAFILHGIITNTVGLIGLIGNIICIKVLRRPQMRGNSTNVILSALSAFDAFLIVTSILMLG